MSKKWSGGIISKSPVELNSYYQNAQASGIWTIPQMDYWNKQGKWPMPGNISGWGSQWILGGTTYLHRAQCCSGVYNGNIAVGGFITVSAVTKATVAVYNSSGILQWSRYMGGTSGSKIYSTFFDSVGNVYAVGLDNASNSSILFKFNSTGTIQRQLSWNGGGGNVPAYGCVDSVDNIYLVSSTSGKINVIKYNSSFVEQWQKSFLIAGGSFNYCTVSDIAWYSSNIYIAGFYKLNNTTSDGTPFVTTFSTAGGAGWQTSVTGTTPVVGWYTQLSGGIGVDSTGSSYFASKVYNPTSTVVLTKFNTSGGMVWSKSISVGSYGYSVAVDSSNYIYVASGTRLLKFDTNGNLIWQRNLPEGNGDFTVDSGPTNTSRIYTSGYTSNAWLAFRLDTNGIGTGSRTIGTYANQYNVTTDVTIDTSAAVYTTLAFSTAVSAFTTSTPTFTISDGGTSNVTTVQFI
jgi:hypothetical protein